MSVAEWKFLRDAKMVFDIEWTRPALSDLKEAGNFIASDNPHAAQRMANTELHPK